MNALTPMTEQEWLRSQAPPYPIQRRVKFPDGSVGEWSPLYRGPDPWPKAWLAMGYAVDLLLSNGALVTLRNKKSWKPRYGR